MKKLQLPKRYKKQTPMMISRPKYIIIHNGVCLEEYPEPVVETDSVKYQYDEVKFNHINRLKLSDVNYHFTLDFINGDYEVLVGKPFHSRCTFEDIEDVYQNSIHVAILGDYSIDIADKRLYDTLAYRIIVPLMYWFYLDTDNIKTHSEVSNHEDLRCPGIHFYKEILINAVTKYRYGR